MREYIAERTGGAQKQEDLDGWHWPSMLYIAFHILNINEETFWKMRPITFQCLFDAHKQTMGPSKSPSAEPEIIPIDQAPAWW